MQELSQAVSAESVALGLNKEVYAALAGGGRFEPKTPRRSITWSASSWGTSLSGVDRDEATRTRVRELAEKMTELSMAFSRTVQDDVRRITVDDLEELEGLPEDYLTRHGIRSEGGWLVSDAPVVLTTDPPEMSPVMAYATSPLLRRRMYLAYNDRGYPANKQVLLDLLRLRQEMSELLGFRSWADLATVDQMMGSAAKMRGFLGEVEEAARDMSPRRSMTSWRRLSRERDQAALPLTLSDARYWEEQFRRAKYDFDSQSVRPYFPYEQVEAGILATAGKLFGVRFERAADAAVWADGVKAFDVVDLTALPTHVDGPS